MINMKNKIHQIASWNRQKLSHSLHLQASKIFVHEERGPIQARWTQCHYRHQIATARVLFFFRLVFYSGSGPSEAWGGALGAPPEAAAISPCFLTPDTMSSILRSNTAVWREKFNHIHSCYLKTISHNFMNKQAFCIKDDFVKFYSLFCFKTHIYNIKHIHATFITNILHQGVFQISKTDPKKAPENKVKSI